MDSRKGVRATRGQWCGLVVGTCCVSKARALRLKRTHFRALYRLARLLVRVALEVRLQLNGCLDLCCREVSTDAFRCAWGAGWGGVRV